MLLDNREPKMFVLVRDDLYSASYKAVQGGHAVAEFFVSGLSKGSWNNGYMIYLAVKDEDKLIKYAYKLFKNNIKFSLFREPDLDNEATSLACICDGKIFKKLNLL